MEGYLLKGNDETIMLYRWFGWGVSIQLFAQPMKTHVPVSDKLKKIVGIGVECGTIKNILLRVVEGFGFELYKEWWTKSVNEFYKRLKKKTLDGFFWTKWLQQYVRQDVCIIFISENSLEKKYKERTKLFLSMIWNYIYCIRWQQHLEQKKCRETQQDWLNPFVSFSKRYWIKK